MSPYQLVTNVVFRPVNSEAILLNVTTGDYYGLDVVATHMLGHLLEHGDPERAVVSICTEYDVEPSRARADLDCLVEQLVAEGLLERPAG
ncbi:MAG: PqqD family peptide modification chaperone [Ardenticatenaceae bacterium]|nr:PqqD family peptide modification chaperone [Ardenticatenaceae bacterium]